MKPNICPVNHQRISVRHLRKLPIRANTRLKILDYRLTESFGMINGKPRSHGHGSALLPGGYLLAICITRSGGEWYLEAERRCYDIDGTRRTNTDFPPQLLADVYWAVQQKHLAAQGMAHARGTGRN